MKRFTALLLAVLTLALSALAFAEVPGLIDVEVLADCAPAPFTLDINGTEVSSELLAELPVYSATATSVNSQGTEKVYVYAGYSLVDVLAAVGVTEGYTAVEATADDGYSITYDAALAALPTTLVAFLRDGESFEGGLWFAPCSSATSGDYLKRTVALKVDAEIKLPVAEQTAEQPSADLPKISDKTGKVEFAPYCFKVNGEEVNNDKLAALSIYKITVNVTNSKGETSEVTYGGYKLADVLATCGVADATSVTAVANDGYETKLDASVISSDYTLLAIEKDKETGKDGTVWVAPCEATESKAYVKLVVELKAEK